MGYVFLTDVSVETGCHVLRVQIVNTNVGICIRLDVIAVHLAEGKIIGRSAHAVG